MCKHNPVCVGHNLGTLPTKIAAYFYCYYSSFPTLSVEKRFLFLFFVFVLFCFFLTGKRRSNLHSRRLVNFEKAVQGTLPQQTFFI